MRWRRAPGAAPVSPAVRAPLHVEAVLEQDRPGLVVLPIDYRENQKLSERLGHIELPI